MSVVHLKGKVHFTYKISALFYSSNMLRLIEYVVAVLQFMESQHLHENLK